MSGTSGWILILASPLTSLFTCALALRFGIAISNHSTYKLQILIGGLWQAERKGAQGRIWGSHAIHWSNSQNSHESFKLFFFSGPPPVVWRLAHPPVTGDLKTVIMCIFYRMKLKTLAVWHWIQIIHNPGDTSPWNLKYWIYKYLCQWCWNVCPG